ncbi:MAG: hypothetical protein ACR2G6_17570, partial [Gemmatimonadaceae bacterium]
SQTGDEPRRLDPPDGVDRVMGSGLGHNRGSIRSSTLVVGSDHYGTALMRPALQNFHASCARRGRRERRQWNCIRSTC